MATTAAARFAILPIVVVYLGCAPATGPLARTIDDLRSALNTLAGHDPRDPCSSFAPITPKRAYPPCKVAVLTELDGVATDPEVKEALDTAARWLADAGYQVEACARHDVWCSQIRISGSPECVSIL